MLQTEDLFVSIYPIGSSGPSTHDEDTQFLGCEYQCDSCERECVSIPGEDG